MPYNETVDDFFAAVGFYSLPLINQRMDELSLGHIESSGLYLLGRK